MGDLKSKVTEKPAPSGLLAKMQEAAKVRQRVYVALSGGLCLEFRAPANDAEYDRITHEAKMWALKRQNKTAPASFISNGPKSPTRFGMCHVAATLMVGAYDSYDISTDGEITPNGEMVPPLTFEEWLKFARENYQQFDNIIAATDRESVRGIQSARDEEFEEEGKD